MKNFRLFYLLFSLLCLSVGCDTLDVNKADNEVVLKLSVDQLSQNKAHIRVRHNGDGNQFWFSFVTDDLTSDATELFESELNASLDFYGQINANVGVNKSVQFANLTARSDYRVIAAAINPDGTRCSNVATVEFTTMRNLNDFFENENWEISYVRREASESDPNLKKEVFEITSTDSLTYYPFVVLKEDFANLYNSDKQKCFESYVEFRNQENIRWSKAVMVADTTYRQDRLRAGDYFVFMMGIDKEGELTGHYAYEELTLRQEQQLPAYSQWIGRWSISGTTFDNMQKNYEIEIRADENNLYYNMYGWESDVDHDYYDNVPQDFPIPLYFEETTGKAYVTSTFLGEPQEDVLFYIYGNAMINEKVTPINIENKKVACFEMVGDKPFLSAEQFSVYDDAGEYLNDDYFSFGYCYTLRGFEYVGFAPFTADSKVIVLSGVEITKL